LWEQVIVGPLSSSEATALVKDFESEPEKNEAFSVFWEFSVEHLDEARSLGVRIIGPDASPEEVGTVRR
jgi:hypothetical protein